MPLQSMQKLIKKRVNMNSKTVKIFILMILMFQVGCTSIPKKVDLKSEKKSCDEEVQPKSLEYLEQQYRCTRSDEG